MNPLVRCRSSILNSDLIYGKEHDFIAIGGGSGGFNAAE